MKTRKFFVSNSSSSSFIIDRTCLSPEQEDFIINHKTWGPLFQKEFETNPLFKSVCRIREANFDGEHDFWNVKVEDEKIYLDTYLDNFDMENYLIMIDAYCEVL